MLTPEEEFDIMKLVLDKFLWIGTIILLYGGWIMLKGTREAITDSLLIIAAGAIILILMLVLLVRDYEWAKRG